MSIKDNALIVSLTVRKPQLSQKDEKATHDAETANNAAGAGKYTKDLYPKALIAPIVAVESAARAYIERNTYPWGRGRGSDLLPMTKFMDFTTRMGEFNIQFSQAVTVFLNNWSNVMLEAQRRQGDMFDANAYPDVSDLKAQFTFEVGYTPVTDMGDFRVAASEAEKEILKAAVERDVLRAQEHLIEAPLQRLKAAVEKLATVTGSSRTKTNAKTGEVETVAPIFRDTLIENLLHEVSMISEFADLLPSNVKAIAAQAKEIAPHPDALRVDPDLRTRTHTASKSLLAAIEEMM
jgi:methyl-accepting chemotaxis protein